MTISDKEELKNEIYKLKRHNVPSPFIMYSEKETISLNSVIDLVDRLKKPEITKEQAYSKLAETLPISTPDLIKSVEKLVFGGCSLNDTKPKSESETVATVIFDYMKAKKRCKEVLGMEVEEVEE